MKPVLALIIVATIALPVAVGWFIDVPTALFVLVAWLVVLVCGGAPIVFSTVTRRAERRRAEREDATELRR
ncbi:MAG: hypothetical protein ACK4WH_01160 [Phycisphaerales bacterium]